MTGHTEPGRDRLVRVTEVGPRDGLQNEAVRVPTAVKVEFINRLAAAGFPEIEATSFVSAKWVPQLGDAAEVMRTVARRAGTIFSALVPNERGLDAALESRVDKVAVFTSASESFSQRNTNGSIDEVLARLAGVVARARAVGLPVRGYISCVVRCPFEGAIEPSKVREVAQRLLAMGCPEIDLGDTIGAAEPDDISRLYESLGGVVAPHESTLHLHDTRHRASACVERALTLGVRSFDSSTAGLGGCPFAPGAPGNLASEALVKTIEGAGFDAGIDTAALAAAAQWIRHELGALRGASE